MRNTSVDDRGELILGFDLGVQNVIGHIHKLHYLYFFSVLTVLFYSYRHILVFFPLFNFYFENDEI